MSQEEVKNDKRVNTLLNKVFSFYKHALDRIEHPFLNLLIVFIVTVLLIIAIILFKETMNPILVLIFLTGVIVFFTLIALAVVYLDKKYKYIDNVLDYHKRLEEDFTKALRNTTSERMKSKEINAVVSVPLTHLDFGDVSVNQKTEKTLEISNTGTAPCIVYNIEISGEDEYLFGTIPNKFCLNSKSTQEVSVSFLPLSNGSKSAHLHIIHNAAEDPTTIYLSGLSK
jgi:hypothetical protein